MSDETTDDEIAASVARTIASIRRHPLDAHAQEIGRLCMIWNRLELAVAILLDDLLDIQHRDTVNILMGALDFRAKVQIAAPLAFSKKKSLDWFERLQSELNSVDNDLRPERNRMVHDFWSGGGGLPVNRTQLGARVVKDQRDKILKLATVKPVTADEITMLIVRVARAIGAIDILREEYSGLSLALPKIPNAREPTPGPSPDQSTEAE